MLFGFEYYLKKYLNTILLYVCGPMAQVDISEIDRKSQCDQSVNKSHNFWKTWRILIIQADLDSCWNSSHCTDWNKPHILDINISVGLLKKAKSFFFSMLFNFYVIFMQIYPTLCFISTLNLHYCVANFITYTKMYEFIYLPCKLMLLCHFCDNPKIFSDNAQKSIFTPGTVTWR